MKRAILIGLIGLLLLVTLVTTALAQDRGVVVVSGQTLPWHWQGGDNVAFMPSVPGAVAYGGYGYSGYGGYGGYGYGGEISLGEIITSIIPLERCQWVKINGQKQQVCSGSRLRIGH